MSEYDNRGWTEKEIDGVTHWVRSSDRLGGGVRPNRWGDGWYADVWCFLSSNMIEDGEFGTLEEAKAMVDRVFAEEEQP